MSYFFRHVKEHAIVVSQEEAMNILIHIVGLFGSFGSFELYLAHIDFFGLLDLDYCYFLRK
jgi:hypothetical protein